jgi:hypothetical protein
VVMMALWLSLPLSSSMVLMVLILLLWDTSWCG